MISSIINPIGDTYSAEDMIVDTVIEVYGVELEHDYGCITIKDGDRYIDGIVVGIFIHPESDCVWIVVECNGTYFEVVFDGFNKYEGYYTKPRHIKDSTELSGGVYW